MNHFTFLQDLNTTIPEIPADSIVSRSLLKNEHIDVTLFGFAAGQELSEHTASRPAILHFISGEAELTLGLEKETATAGSWVHIPPKLPHSIAAKTAVTMLLIMLKSK